MMMRGIALPTGAYDWRAELAPEAAFRARVAAVRRIMHESDLAHAIVAGSTFDDGALIWLTSFTPKLGPAFALIPAQGEPRLIFSGGPGMRSSAQRLTWIADVAAKKSLAGDLKVFLDGAGRLGVYEGAALAYADWRAIRGAAAEVILLDDRIDALRRSHADADFAVIGEGAARLGRVEAALARAVSSGLDRRAALIAAEQEACDLGAQDFRARISVRAFGPPEPADACEPLPAAGVRAAFALRLRHWWVTGTATLGTLPQHARDALAGALHAATNALSPTATPAALRAAIPPSCSIQVETVGFSMCERALPPDAPFGANSALSVSFVLRDDAAPVSGSALFALHEDGARVLWRATALSDGGTGPGAITT